MQFAYTILYVPDVRRAVEFYEQAFGLTRRFIAEEGYYAELDTGGTTLSFSSLEFARQNFPEGVRPHDPAQAPAAVEVAFTTADVPAAFQRAVAAGAQPLVEPNQKPWGQTVAYVRDPDGILIEICTPM